MVGCVIVHNDTIIGQGYHKKNGESHAEVNAINSVKDLKMLEESTLFVNLEPCSHTGKTPPCSDIIIKYKIPRVVIGCIDPFPKVSGEGIKKMESAGITVQHGCLSTQSKELNKRFIIFHTKKRPYITLKWAQSQDKFIAPKNQKEPLWLTCEKSKELVHKWRGEEDAVLIGRITAKLDNPKLTVREVNGRNPIRIVIDRKLRLPNSINIYNDEARTITFNSVKNTKIGSNEFIKIDFKDMVNQILHVLYKKNIQSVIIEGGSITLQSFIDQEIWDEARVFTTKTMLLDGVRAPEINKGQYSKKKIGNDNLSIILND